MNGAKVDLPLRLQPDIQVEEQLPYVVVDSPLGFRVKFDGDHQLFIQVSERYKGHLCGLCGTYSGSPLDDFQQPDGMLETDANKFGNSWRVEDDDWRQVIVNKAFSGVYHIFRTVFSYLDCEAPE